MYSVVEITGHQYKVQAGDLIDVEKINSVEEGAEVEFDRVLFVGGETPVVGAPTVAGAKVKAKLIRNDRSRKIVVFKRSPGKYQRKNGHRQHYSALLITEIVDGNGKSVKIEADSKNAKKYLK